MPRRRRTWPAGRRFLGRRFLLAAWVDKATAIGVTPTRALAVTTRRGNWTTAKARADSAQAISASRTSGGTLEVDALTDMEIQQSVDSGASFSPIDTH